jgi:hypothetical protein
VLEARVPDERDAADGSAWHPLDGAFGNATNVVRASVVRLVPAAPGLPGAVQRHSTGRLPDLLHFFFLTVGLGP